MGTELLGLGFLVGGFKYILCNALFYSLLHKETGVEEDARWYMKFFYVEWLLISLFTIVKLKFFQLRMRSTLYCAAKISIL